MATAKKTVKTDATVAAFDPAAFFKFPAFDVEKFAEIGRKNMEALVEANKLTFDAYKAAAERQAANVKADVEAMTAQTKSFFEVKPELDANKNLETAKTQLDEIRARVEKQVAETREIAELTAKAHQDAFEVLKKRFEDSVEEVKSLAA